MKIIRYTNLENNLLNDWLDLWKRSKFANYANGPQWFISVLETFHYANFIILAIYEEDTLLGIASLIKEKKVGVAVYTLPPGDFVLGIPFLIDYQNKKIMEELLNQLLQTGTIVLDNISEQYLTELKKYTSEIEYTQNSINYFMYFNKDEKGNVLIRKKNKLLKPARNIEKKLSMKFFNGETSGDILDIVFSIDGKGRRETRGYSAFSSKLTRNFYLSLAKRLKNNLLINILYFEQEPIAYEIGFLLGTTYIGSQIASLKAYDNYSILRVFLVKLIDYLNSIHVEKLDFGSGDAAIKRSFSKEYRKLYRVVISQNSAARFYLKIIYILRHNLFELLKQHMKIYMAYRNIRKVIGK